MFDLVLPINFYCFCQIAVELKTILLLNVETEKHGNKNTLKEIFFSFLQQVSELIPTFSPIAFFFVHSIDLPNITLQEKQKKGIKIIISIYIIYPYID